MCEGVSRRMILFGLLAACGSACGSEPAPWSGFPLFPERDGSVEVVPDRPEMNQPAVPAAGMVAEPAAAGSGGVTTAPMPPSDAPDTSMTAAAEGGTSAVVEAMPTVVVSDAFRITELYLRDPHLFAGISDLTEQPVLNVSINQILIPAKLTMDSDRDGFLDVSSIFVMTRSDARAMSGTLMAVDGKCATNTPTYCVHDPSSTLRATWQFDTHTSGSCLEPLAGTTSAYQPPITLPSAPCIVSSISEELMFNLGGVEIPVLGARVSATYRTDPTPALTNGLIAGFVTNTAAMRVVLPEAAGPLAAGSSLSNYVRQQDHDLASSPTGEDGFWIYLNFVAQPVEYTP